MTMPLGTMVLACIVKLSKAWEVALGPDSETATYSEVPAAQAARGAPPTRTWIRRLRRALAASSGGRSSTAPVASRARASRRLTLAFRQRTRRGDKIQIPRDLRSGHRIQARQQVQLPLHPPPAGSAQVQSHRPHPRQRRLILERRPPVERPQHRLLGSVSGHLHIQGGPAQPCRRHHARAVRKLEAAIRAARRAGCSWRTIGRVAGLPFQTLARRYGRQATFSPTGGPVSDAA